MIIVSNTSPITNLAAIGKLELLEQLYGNIIIPEAVFRELTEVISPVPGTKEVQTLNWIQVQQVSNQILLTALQQELDPGEAEAIILAIELKSNLLLLDERRGRQMAGNFNVKVQGVLGILLTAKFRGLIPVIKPLVDELIGKAGFWVSQAVYTRVLQLADEI